MMFFKKIEKLCLNKGITVTDLVLSIGLSGSNVTYWKNGSIPRGKTLKKIADYFDISIDSLVSNESSLDKINLVMEELASYSAADNKQISIDMEAIKKLSEESQNELFNLIEKTVAKMREAEEKEKAIKIIKSLPAEDRKAIKNML
jgi:transcriptional regulator with XRE-family HTH domain